METKNSPGKTLLSPEGGNPFSPQGELRIRLDLSIEGELQSGGFFLLIAASAVERTQVYLHEHLPICCHFLPTTMGLIREPFYIGCRDGRKSECTTSQKK